MKGENLTINAVVTEGQPAEDIIYVDCGYDVEVRDKRVHRTADHIVGKKDDVLELSRTLPVGNGDTYGNSRSISRFRRDVTVANALGADISRKAKIEIHTSFPVGMSDAEIDRLCNLASAWITHASFQDLAVKCIN